MSVRPVRGLKPRTVDPRTRTQVRRMMDGWRQHGLEADLVEYVAPKGEPGGYVVTVRRPGTEAICLCQNWRQRRGLFGGRDLWTITVTVRDEQGGSRPAGVVAALDHEQAWAGVIDWADGRGSLSADLPAAVARLG